MVNTPNVVIINDRVEIISVKKGKCSEVLLNVNFCDKNNKLVAKILENTWWVFTESIWDLIYKPRELTILNKPRDIGLSIKIEKGEIFIKGVLYFNGFPIKITDRYVEAGPLRLSGSTFTNGINGLSINLGP